MRSITQRLDGDGVDAARCITTSDRAGRARFSLSPAAALAPAKRRSFWLLVVEIVVAVAGYQTIGRAFVHSSRARHALLTALPGASAEPAARHARADATAAAGPRRGAASAARRAAIAGVGVGAGEQRSHERATGHPIGDNMYTAYALLVELYEPTVVIANGTPARRRVRVVAAARPARPTTTRRRA